MVFAVGCHVSKDSFSSLEKSILNCVEEMGVGCVQIYTHGPMSLKKNNTGIGPDSEVLGLGLSIFMHTPYAAVGIWTNPAKYIGYMKSEIEEARVLGSAGIVLHLKDVAPEVVAKSLSFLNEKVGFDGVRIVLEMPARSQTATSYDRPERLVALAKLLRRCDFDWGFCIDTSHLWAAGHDLSGRVGMKAWLDAAKKVWDRIVLFHVNSNIQKNFGTGKDCHVIPFAKEDAMWSRAKFESTGLKYLVEFAKKKGICCVVEAKRDKKRGGKKSRLQSCMNVMLS